MHTRESVDSDSLFQTFFSKHMQKCVVVEKIGKEKYSQIPMGFQWTWIYGRASG